MTRTALLIGAPQTGRPKDALPGVLDDVSAASRILSDYGFSCRPLVGPGARRDAILSALDELVETTSTGDAVVLYYSGHGGQVTNVGVICDLVSGSYAPRFHQFLVPEDYYDHEDEFGGVLDIELAYLAARLSLRTDNLTVILDCCHSGGLMRDGARAKGLDGSEFNARASALNVLITRRLEALGERIAREQGEWPRLDPDANPRWIRLEAAHAERVGLQVELAPDKWRGALTAAWEAAVRRYRGRAITWDGLFPYLRGRVAGYTNDAQIPWLSGPRHRLLFQVEEAPALDTLSVQRRGERWYLGGGRLYGVRVGDRYRVVPAATVIEPAGERADVSLAVLRVVEVAPHAALVEVEESMAPEDTLDGARSVPVRVVPERAAILCAQRSGEGAHALTTPFEVRWWREPGGVGQAAVSPGADDPTVIRHPPEAAATASAPVRVYEGERIWCEVHNRAPRRAQRSRLYVTVFDIGVDGRVARLTRAEAGGLCLYPNERQPLGYRPHGGARPLEITWPEAMARDPDDPGLRSLVIIVADREHDFTGFEDFDLDLYEPGAPPVISDFLSPVSPATMRSSGPATKRDPMALRYALVRIDWLVVPA
ncbi:caspase family protein [Haliangium sp.]